MVSRDGKRKLCRRSLPLLLVLCMAFGLAPGCTACGSGADGGTGGIGVGGGASAASMFLRKTEGTVAVADAEGADVAPVENLGLYSGYTVGTGAESCAWIDLDKVKLTKLDANSAVEITKDGKNLTIDIVSGSFFFNVTEPLAGDETMELCTSSMLVGIRGTCGWVEVPDSSTMRVYLLEGKVECAAGENTAMVNAGETAEMTVDGTIEVSAFTSWDMPDFVKEEIKTDEALREAVLAASGIDIAEDLLSGYPDISRWVNGREVLFAEELDFEADGSPELMVLYTQEEGYHFRIFQKGTEQSQLLCNAGIQSGGATGKKISLVESEGKLFVCTYWRIDSEEGPDVNHSYAYYGSAAQADGDDSCWGRIDAVWRQRTMDSPFYHRAGLSENGLREDASKVSTAEEYEAVIAQYTEVRVLFEMDG